MTNFSCPFQIFFDRFKKVEYYLYIMRQTARLVFKPIVAEGCAAVCSFTSVVQASDSMTTST